MADTPAPRKSPFGDIAPALGKYTDDVLFGDVWKRPQLSPRDRSLVTVSSSWRNTGSTNYRSTSNSRCRTASPVRN